MHSVILWVKTFLTAFLYRPGFLYSIPWLVALAPHFSMVNIFCFCLLITNKKKKNKNFLIPLPLHDGYLEVCVYFFFFFRDYNQSLSERMKRIGSIVMLPDVAISPFNLSTLPHNLGGRSSPLSTVLNPWVPMKVHFLS